MGKYFGTDGVRGRVGDTLTVQMAFRIGRYLGQFPNGKKNLILIGQDTRISSPMLAASLKSGITSSGSNVYDVGVTTTPSLSFLSRRDDAIDYAIMVSASHNPYYDNGIKVFNRNGEKLEKDIESLIEQFMDQPNDHLVVRQGKALGETISSAPLLQDYLAFLRSKATFKNIPLRILIDCANGSAFRFAKDLFTSLGLKVSMLFDQPNGTNINERCGATHLAALTSAMKQGTYDLGLAFDGDADRLMAIAPDGTLIDGDAQLYLHARALKETGQLKNPRIVLTVMSNLGLRLALEKLGIAFDEVPVGDRNVQLALKEKKLPLGGEQSGHVIFFDDLNTGDGLLSAIKLLNILIASKRSVKENLADYRVYPQLIKNLTVPNKDIVLADRKVQSLIQTITRSLNQKGRVFVRPSGTEPLIRIMIEAATLEECEKYSKQIADLITDTFIH